MRCQCFLYQRCDVDGLGHFLPSQSVRLFLVNNQDRFFPGVWCKVKNTVHDSPNLIPGIDLRCFAKKNTLLAQKNCSTQILLFDTKRPTLVTKLPKLGIRYTILDILMHVNSYITFVNLCDLCDMFKDRLQYTLQYNIMINDSNPKKWVFFANDITFWPWYDAP